MLAPQTIPNSAMRCRSRRCLSPRHGEGLYCWLHQSDMDINRQLTSRCAAFKSRKGPWGKPVERDLYEIWRLRAAAAVKAAVKFGVLPQLADGEYACVDCGGIATQYDHRDYARALDVEPVCRSCNNHRGTAAWPTADRFQFKRVGE